MRKIGSAVDGLVRELYSEQHVGGSTIQEPEISSRICQRLEDRLDGELIGEFHLSVTAQSMPDRGPRSLERITGADILLQVSLDGPEAFDKGVFVQAKYDRNLDREELQDACRRMDNVSGEKGGYVWIYGRRGVKVYSSGQVRTLGSRSLESIQSRSVAGLTGRILDCYAGSTDWGVPPFSKKRRREVIASRLRHLRIENGVDVVIKSEY